MSANDYNARLFEGNWIRSLYHNYRFNLVSKIINEKLTEGENLRLAEIGCYDARILSYLDKNIISYCGIDLDWERGLTQARKKFSKYQNIKLYNAEKDEELASFLKQPVDTLISLETFEHLSAEQLKIYVNFINKAHPNNCYITVPNEIGLVFILKKLFQILILKNSVGFSPKEFICQSLGLVNFVQRKEHKGFSYYELKKLLDYECPNFEVKFSHRWIVRVFTPTILIKMDFER